MNNVNLLYYFLIFFVEPDFYPVSSFTTELNKYLMKLTTFIESYVFNFLNIKMENLTLLGFKIYYVGRQMFDVL